MIARIHDDGGLKVGSMMSQTRLAIHAGRSQTWVRLQGNVVNVRGEIWQANFYNGGRIQGYTLMSLAPMAMCIERAEQPAGAAAMK